MVFWITTQIGLKSCEQDISDEEYGSVIIDLRNIKDVNFGKTDEEKKTSVAKNYPVVLNAMQRIFKIIANRDMRVILQDEDGVSTSATFMVGMLVYGTMMEWDDAIKFVKSKCKNAVILDDLLTCIKMVVMG